MPLSLVNHLINKFKTQFQGKSSPNKAPTNGPSLKRSFFQKSQKTAGSSVNPPKTSSQPVKSFLAGAMSGVPGWVVGKAAVVSVPAGRNDALRALNAKLDPKWPDSGWAKTLEDHVEYWLGQDRLTTYAAQEPWDREAIALEAIGVLEHSLLRQDEERLKPQNLSELQEKNAFAEFQDRFKQSKQDFIAYAILHYDIKTSPRQKG